MSSVGPKLRRSCSQNGSGGFSGLALMVTPCCSSRVSRLSLANDGCCVVKWVAFVPVPGSATGAFVTPVMASPVVVTVTTLSSVTCSLKTLYGSVIVVGCAGASSTFVMKILAASSTSRVIQNRLERNGFGMGGTGAFGAVAGLGARADGGGGETAMLHRQQYAAQRGEERLGLATNYTRGVAAETTLSALSSGYIELAALVRALHGDWTAPAPGYDGWTCRDLLAHLSSSAASLPAVASSVAETRDPNAAPFDSTRWNASQVRRRAEKQPQDLIDEYDSGTTRLVMALSDADLDAPVTVGPYAGLALGKTMAEMLEHQRRHISDLERALRA